MIRLTQRLVPLAVLLTLTAACSMHGSRVAIIDFENATGTEDYDFLESALPEYLVPTLANDHSIVLLERQTLRDFFAGISPDASDPDNLAQWQRLGRKYGAHYFVVGSLSRLEANFVLTARIFDVTTGEVVPGTAVTNSCTREEEIYHRAQAIARALREDLERLQKPRLP